jgi:dipeptidase D
MGPLTLSLTTLGRGDDGNLTAGINIRAPMGRSPSELQSAVAGAIEAWVAETGIGTVDHSMLTSDPYYLEDAPHVPILLDIFRHYTGRTEAGPVSIGGGTHARLLPNAVNFGPAMPDAPYTGHSEHEYMSEAQFRLNLEMYTAMLVELAGG